MRSIIWDLGRKISTPLYSAQDDTKQPSSAGIMAKKYPQVSKFLKDGVWGRKAFFKKFSSPH